ncbi:MAG: phosphate uptake regulator PhoU [Nanoarchaeota archaeon]|nr:phosphate uptake regulator PhoU [Nanoarchaeota archaeon]
MHIRKLVQSGLASYTVALPKDWIIRNRLKKGERIYINESKEGLVLTTEPTKESINEFCLSINIDEKTEKQVITEIIASYLNNCHEITLRGKNVQKYLATIKKIASYLVGYEPIEEEVNKITLRSFVHLNDAHPSQILRRIDNILRSMMIDTKTVLENPDMAENIRLRDKSVNRFVFLLQRVIKASVLDPNVARHTNLKPFETLIYWEMAHHLEKIGDGVKRYALLMTKLGKNQKLHERTLMIIEQFYMLYEKAMISFYQKNIDQSDQVSTLKEQLKKICNQYEEDYKSTATANFSNKFVSIISHVVDITRYSRYTE